MPLISSTKKAGTGTSPAIDTSTAKSIHAVICGAVPVGGLSDNKGNTYVERTPKGSIGNDSETSLWDCLNPIVGTGHTFTITGTATAVIIEAHDAGDLEFDIESGVPEEATPVKPGALTPSANGALIITGCGGICANSSVDSPFVEAETDINVAAGVNYGVGLAHYYQATAALVDPEWTIAGSGGLSTQAAAVMAVYKPATAPSPATAYTFTGPSSGALNTPSTNFTVTPNGDADGITVTPASDGTGTFSPTSVTFSGSSAATFTYTPTSTAGTPHTLSVTDDGVLTDPASIDYEVLETAGALVMLGDSFSAQTALSAGSRTSAILGEILGEDWIVTNSGIGGNTIEQAEARISTDVVPYLIGTQYNAVLFFLGINNISPLGSNESAATAYAKYLTALATLKAACPAGTIIIVCELPPATDATYLTRRGQFNVFIKNETSPRWREVARLSFDVRYGADEAAGDSIWYAGDEHPTAALAEQYAVVAAATLAQIIQPMPKPGRNVSLKTGGGL